jgi:succinyl-diaminopimelate desuccinylase
LNFTALELTQKLIGFNSCNPPGNEAEIAKYCGNILLDHGFEISYYEMAVNRLHLIAEKGLSKDKLPIILTGHFDTVPLGEVPWQYNPYQATVSDGKLYGRGASDMKSGVAALIYAAIQSFEKQFVVGGIRFILTAGEENFCEGMQQLANHPDAYLGSASAIIVGEPTSNQPAIGHKGALLLNAVSRGVTAHSSMPDDGENAIYKAAQAITSIANIKWNVKDKWLGATTINVGIISGGMNPNSVPDNAQFSIDARTTAAFDNKKVLGHLKKILGDKVYLETIVDLEPVISLPNSSFISTVLAVCKKNQEDWRLTLPYVTDASILKKLYPNVPVIILGPGEARQAHQTDEFCYIEKISEAVELYKNIIIKWSEESNE